LLFFVCPVLSDEQRFRTKSSCAVGMHAVLGETKRRAEDANAGSMTLCPTHLVDLDLVVVLHGATGFQIGRG